MQRSWLLGMPVWMAACLAVANETKTLDLGGGITLEVVRVEAGTFTQGSPVTEEGRAADETQRQVTISQPFWIGRTAVTVGQWKRFVAETGYRTEAETGTSGGFGWNGKELVQQKQFTWKSPGFGQSPDDPVCLVTFPDAGEFCKWVAKKTPLRVTLPTEAQWEYACRAGSTAPWHDGTSTISAAGVKTDLAWHKGNSNNSTHATASTASNLWGVRIGGNVSEWCLDWYAPYDAGATTDPLQTNQNLSDKPRRVLRGGSWIRELKNTRSAARYRADPRSRNADIGFRIAAPYQVIAEATTPPPIPPKSSPSSAGAPNPISSTGDSSSNPLQLRSKSFHVGGLACLLIPLGALAAIVVAIVKAASRRKSSSPPPFPPGNNDYLPKTPAMQHQVRMTEDGFWLQTDAAAGTPLDVSYRLADGIEQRSRLTYQPGPQGHFVFTGRRPLSVSIMPIVAAAAAGAMASRMFNQPPPMHHTVLDNDDDTWSRPVPPPRNPAAY